MEEWKICKVKDLAIMKNGKKRPNTVGHYPVYGGNGIMDYCNTYNNENTIIIGRVGAYCGNVFYCKGKCWVSDNAIALCANSDNNIKYLYYLLASLDLHHNHIGGAQPLMTQDIIGNFDVCVPILETQVQIANILTSFDDKIELNNRINHNLEEQAQALYKSWFVDFEPFRGGNFVNSELGMIPEGWRVGCYNDIISSTVSGDWGKDREVGNYTHKVSCIRGCDFADVSSGIRGKTPERFVLEKNFQNKRLLDKDIIVEISGGTPTMSTGRICLVSDNLLDKYSGNIVCTNFCRVIRPCSGYSSYVFYSWLDKYNSRVMFGYENGTSGIKNFQISDFMEKEPVIIPPQTVIAQFQTIVDVYQAVIQRNGNERMECETVRDALLPKLMSGELKINDLTC